jgi:molybdenum cofactor biosynthesis enzyme MoaA
LKSHNIIDKITITGGEPLIRADFSPILEKIRLQNDSHLTVVTNGSLIDKRLEAFRFVNEVHISCHSMNPFHWGKIVNASSELLESVLRNIKLLRSVYPDLTLKMNIVADSNNQKEIEDFISFAKRFNLILNVFQEGFDAFRRIAKRLNSNSFYRTPSEFWDLKFLNPELIEENEYKKTYNIDGVKVILSYTSTDRIRWNSIWMSPEGLMFCDPEHRTQEINIKKSLNRYSVVKAINSMIEEIEIRNANKSENQIRRQILYINEDRKQSFTCSNMIEHIRNSIYADRKKETGLNRFTELKRTG